MFDKYINFIRGVSVNRTGKVGVVLTTSSFLTFIILEIPRLLGLLTNAYMGLVTYLLLPVLFVVGLLLIPYSWQQYKAQRGKETKELLSERFNSEETKEGFLGSKIFLTVGALTLLNVIFLSGASLRMLTFMDGPEFCGTACHSVMNPEWVTYQQSPHARVACVDCHVGEGVGALVSSKLNGTWQMISVTFNLYERPIPTPVHQLRPARETCEKCHWPDKFYGNKLKTMIRYKHDEQSTPQYTSLNLKIDAGHGGQKAGIHWHVAAENEVRYASVNDERKEMIWVDARQPDGTFRRYTNAKLSGNQPADAENERIMDCVDCHNRATHIYENPDKAIDLRMAQGLIDRSLPYIKREAIGALMGSYSDKDAGMEGVRNHIEGFYRKNYPDVLRSQSESIDQAVKTVQAVYYRNIHPGMNITWGSYPSHLGHEKDLGCFRCHNGELKDENGAIISNDCTTCHSILADEEPQPFLYLFPADSTERNFEKHKYLREEFLGSFINN
jgi:hypothetical protein